METKLIVAVVVWLAFCAFVFFFNYGAKPQPKENNLNELDRVKLKITSSCIDMSDNDGNHIIRIMPHGTMWQDKSKIEEYSQEITCVACNFDKYYNQLK